MRELKIAINQIVMSENFRDKNQKLMFSYSVVASILAGRGFLRLPLLIDEIVKLTGLSTKTAYRHVYNLKDAKLVTFSFHKGNKSKNIPRGIRCKVKGRTYLESPYDTNSKYIIIKGDMLKSYKGFRDGVIRQFAIMTQDRIEHSFEYLDQSEMATCGRESGSVASLLLLKNKKQSGCSLSQLVKVLGIDKRTASLALKGYTRKQSNRSYPIKGTIARKKYKTLLDAIAGDARHRYGIKQETGEVVKVFTKQVEHTIQFEHNEDKDMYVFIGILSSRIINVERCYKTMRRKD